MEAVLNCYRMHIVHGNITTPVLNCNILEDRDYFVFISVSL